ncbi:hypothetical protein GYH30_022182 [Glycine max]|uniref:Uncharacterized protein n=1 Tax=Glycine max TaxID=3847 RepID=A0A0R0IRG9_SOYBN|nr:hypothetical protein GYH30_022182 [Glycine max]
MSRMSKRLTTFYSGITTKDNNSEILILKIQRYFFHTASKFNHCPSLNIDQSINTHNLISNGDHSTDQVTSRCETLTRLPQLMFPFFPNRASLLELRNAQPEKRMIPLQFWTNLLKKVVTVYIWKLDDGLFYFTEDENVQLLNHFLSTMDPEASKNKYTI